MPDTIVVPASVVFERGSFVCMARVENVEGQLITLGSVASVHRQIFKVDDSSNVCRVSPNVVEDKTEIIFDSLQTSPSWTIDTIGYNFKTYIEGDLIPKGDIEIEYRILDTTTPTALWSFIKFQVTAQDIRFDQVTDAC